MELINDKFNDYIFPLKPEEFRRLESNIIADNCIREPLTLWNNIIIDGHNRYEIAKKLNLDFNVIKKEFENEDDVKEWIINNQNGRRNLNTYQRSILALKLKEIYIKRAKEKEQIRKTTFQKSEKSFLPKINTAKKIAKETKVSHDTIAKVDIIEKKATPEIKEKLNKDELSINKVYTDIIKKEQREKIEKEFEQPQSINTEKKYQIIYADPPWKFWAGGNKNQAQHYKTMSIDEIKNLPVKELADKDCILFLWVTFPILPEALEVIKSWDFKYSTCGFNWIKKNKSGKGWFFGLGYWTRANSELCLIATKGSIKRIDASVSQIIDTSIEEHSKKPDIVRDKIIQLVGKLPRIELFARGKLPDGWESWGTEK